jgi:hypothetical protein
MVVVRDQEALILVFLQIPMYYALLSNLSVNDIKFIFDCQHSVVKTSSSVERYLLFMLNAVY